MNWFEKFMSILQYEWKSPTLYGWKHLLFLAIMIGGIVIVCLTCKKLTEKQFRIIMIAFGSVLMVLEIFKQLVFAYKADTNTWEYDWKQFPFQFCSVPMYVMFLIGVLKDCRFRDYLCSFIATFGLFAGLAVMAFPSTVLSDIIFRFCQSMIHHSSMVVGATVVIVSKRVKFEHKTILKAMAVFATVMGIAVIMNIVFHLSGNTASFNMFYIGPYDSCDIPVFQQIGNALNIDANYLHLGNFVFILIYFLAFSLAGYLILLLLMLLNKISSSKCIKKEIVSDNKQ